MIRKIARYTVNEEWMDEVESVIETFVSAIAEHEPATVYTAYRAADSREFIHFMAFPDDAAESTHQQAPYTLAFVEALYPNCKVAPAFTDLSQIASTE